MLDESKRHVLLNKLNFLGYETEPDTKRISLREIKYMGHFENHSITQNNYGNLPSFSKFFGKEKESDDPNEDYILCKLKRIECEYQKVQ